VSSPAPLGPGAGTRVSLAGAGHMGLPIGERILEAGYPLTVFNRTPEKLQPLLDRGAHAAGGLGELLAESDICVSSLSDDAALEAVTTAALAGARPGTILIETSTVSVAASARVAAAAAKAGVLYLRAPVSGNPFVVRSGNLTLIVSGPAEGFEQARDLIAAIGPNVFYVGEADEARIVKLVLQVMIAGTTQLMAESLVLGEAAGVDRAKLLEVMGNSAVGSPFVKYKTEPLLRDDYSATFTTSMMNKDVGIVLELAGERAASLPVTEKVADLLEATIEGGQGDLDLMALYLQCRQAAGLAPLELSAP
jgi:3-hydroxyisobutyrate dehydrogenase-like beta-hydroxyacid dehydrogenase